MKPTVLFSLKTDYFIDTFRRRLQERFNIIFYYSKLPLYQVVFFTLPDIIVIDVHTVHNLSVFINWVGLMKIKDSVIPMSVYPLKSFDFYFKLPINVLEIPSKLLKMHIPPNPANSVKYIYNEKNPDIVLDVEQGFMINFRTGEVIADSPFGFILSSLARWIVRNTFVSHSALEMVINAKLDNPNVFKLKKWNWLKQFGLMSKIAKYGYDKVPLFSSILYFTKGGNYVYHFTFLPSTVVEFSDGTKLLWQERLDAARL